MFTFKLGIFHVPNIGKVDTRNELSNDTLLALYENRKFPFIGVTEEVIPYLKKKKLSEKRLVNLVLQATSVEEINVLLAVKSTKKLKKIAEVQKESLLIS